MARHQAIAAVAAALRGLIRERYPRDDFGTLTVEFYQAKDIEKGIAGDGFAILLWRVAVNVQRRGRAPRVDIFGRRFKPSLPLDLSFLIIPVAASPEKQLRMLGWVMRALEDSNAITASQLNDYLTEDDIFTVDEDIELVCDPLSVGDQLTMWDRIRKHPLFANYLMRMVLIDSERSIEEAGVVLERGFEVGIAEDMA
ncbi:MAG TPA: DUF4255 domain-containing protein [Allosphingosinicella sp.]|jgi:hypothetical protein